MSHPVVQLDRSTGAIATKARAAMSAVCEVEAGRWPVSPFAGNEGFEPAPPVLRVLRMAVKVEPDPVEAGFWYCRTRIAELGGLTAAQLVARGRAGEVVGFLRSVLDGKRG